MCPKEFSAGHMAFHQSEALERKACQEVDSCPFILEWLRKMAMGFNDEYHYNHKLIKGGT